MNRNPWTQQEISLLLRRVNQNPMNLMQVFRELSLEIPHSVGAIKFFYYTYTRKHPVKLFLLAGSRTLSCHRKNSLNATASYRMNYSRWKRAYRILLGEE